MGSTIIHYLSRSWLHFQASTRFLLTSAVNKSLNHGKKFFKNTKTRTRGCLLRSLNAASVPCRLPDFKARFSVWRSTSALILKNKRIFRGIKKVWKKWKFYSAAAEWEWKCLERKKPPNPNRWGQFNWLVDFESNDRKLNDRSKNRKAPKHVWWCPKHPIRIWVTWVRLHLRWNSSTGEHMQ